MSSTTERNLGWLHIALQLAALAVVLAPELAHAQADPTSGLGQVGGWLKSFLKLVIFDWGYYLGAGALAVCGAMLWRGHMALGPFIWCCLGIILFFFAPSITTTLRNTALQSSGLQ